jgi:hypothetical protein
MNKYFIVEIHKCTNTLYDYVICYMFRSNISPPSLILPPTFTLVSCSPYSTLQMEVTCSSETSVTFQWTTCRYIPEDRTTQKYLCYMVQRNVTSTFNSEVMHSLFCLQHNKRHGQ